MNALNLVINRTLGKLMGLRDYRLATFLVFCLILGGTSQDVFNLKGPLYLISIIALAFTVLSPRTLRFSSLKKGSVILLGLFALLHIIYLIPMPPDIWTGLAGRSSITVAFEKLGAALPWMPITMTPERSVMSLLGLLPALTVAILMLDSSRTEINLALFAILFAGALAMLFSGVQFVTKDPLFYFYDVTNMGLGVGWFSNANHHASFAVVCALIAIYLYFEDQQIFMFNLSINNRVAAAVCLFLAVIGTLTAGSMAGFILLLILCPFFLLINLRHSKMFLAFFALGLICVLGVVIADMTILDGILSKRLNFTADSENLSRRAIWDDTRSAMTHLGIFGSGPGSFEQVFALYEDRTDLKRQYVPHAHNDFLQLWMEFGILGIIIILALLVLTASQAVKLLLNIGNMHSIKLLAFLAVMVFLLHSVVDYPLRTPASGALLVYFVLLLDEKKVFNS